MSELAENKLVIQPIRKNFSPGNEDDKHALVVHTHLPDDILMSLTQRTGTRMSLAPPVKSKGKRAKPANVWNHSERREKLKHLTESTTCICGAGRDISFIYDIPPSENVKIKAPEIDPSAIRMRSRDQKRANKTDINLPDTLIPEEFHLVKSKGVMGLEYHEEKFSTNVVDHEKHLTVFPSLKPSSRFEVIKLREAMEKMLQKAGVDDFSDLDTSSSQMHALLSLVKKEQDIYNVIFHELIRQTTVECIERGELLANLRQRYSNLLSKIPEQVKSLHDEVVAQRALDRRLTEELMRFKTTIGVLTSELAEVKKHEESVSKDVHASKDEMKRALDDAKRNADLLTEYHTLYELQRRRLEDQVGILSEEKELWSSAAYCLAMKVTEEYRLITARRLHIAEKSWNELARHFTVLLSDIDTTDLTQLQAVVNEWREHAERFSEYLQKREIQLAKTLDSIQNGVKQFIEYFQDEFLSPEGHLLRSPNPEEVFQIIYTWEKLLSDEAEAFGGDTMLNMQENLSKMRRLVMHWTDGAIKIFQRHTSPPTNDKQPVSTPELTTTEDEATTSPNIQEMHRVNAEVEELLRQFNTRLTGDNGVAQRILTVQNILESWHTRLAAVIHGQGKPIPDGEWSRLYILLPDWMLLVQEIVVLVGRVEREEDNKDNVQRTKLNPTDTMIETQKWASLTNATIDSANGRQMETVTQLHTQMIHWMVQVLLRVAPNHSSSTAEGRMNVLLASASIGELKQSARILFERVQEFTVNLARSCSTIISEITQTKTDRHEEDAEVEANEMRRFQVECDEWTTAAKLLLQEMLSGEVSMETTPVLSTATTGVHFERDSSHPFESTPDGSLEPKDPYMKHKEKNFERVMQQVQVEAITIDGNTHTRSLTQQEQLPPMAIRGGLEELERTVETPNTERAYEALSAVKHLQSQLKQAEERAQTSESETLHLRIQLATSEEKVKSLEEKMTALQRDLDNLIQEQKEQDPLPNLLFRPAVQPPVQAEKEKSKVTTSSEQSKTSRGRGGGTSRR